MDDNRNEGSATLFPPRRLTNAPNHEWFHPSYSRVGVRIDGVERNDIKAYDADGKCYWVTGMDLKRDVPKFALEIEPYWRYAENRQQRRARERWEETHVKS